MPLIALTANPVLLGAVFAGMSFAGALINVMAGVYQVQVTPDEMQGRVGSVAGLLSSGANSFGALTAGFLLASLSVGSTVLGVSAVMALLAVTAWLTPVIRTTQYREGVST
jgi:MFS family permease